MLYWSNLQEDVLYVADLIQPSTGVRFIRFRLPEQAIHDNAVLSSKEYLGRAWKQFVIQRRVSPDIQTTDGRSFGVDAHDTWLTEEEAVYWNNNPSQAALEALDAPWVNKLPPRFAEK